MEALCGKAASARGGDERDDPAAPTGGEAAAAEVSPGRPPQSPAGGEGGPPPTGDADPGEGATQTPLSAEPANRLLPPAGGVGSRQRSAASPRDGGAAAGVGGPRADASAAGRVLEGEDGEEIIPDSQENGLWMTQRGQLGGTAEPRRAFGNAAEEPPTGEAVVGWRCEVWWEGDGCFYSGRVASCSPAGPPGAAAAPGTGGGFLYRVEYDDGDLDEGMLLIDYRLLAKDDGSRVLQVLRYALPDTDEEDSPKACPAPTCPEEDCSRGPVRSPLRLRSWKAPRSHSGRVAPPSPTSRPRRGCSSQGAPSAKP